MLLHEDISEQSEDLLLMDISDLVIPGEGGVAEQELS